MEATWPRTAKRSARPNDEPINETSPARDRNSDDALAPGEELPSLRRRRGRSGRKLALRPPNATRFRWKVNESRRTERDSVIVQFPHYMGRDNSPSLLALSALTCPAAARNRRPCRRPAAGPPLRGASPSRGWRGPAPHRAAVAIAQPREPNKSPALEPIDLPPAIEQGVDMIYIDEELVPQRRPGQRPRPRHVLRGLERRAGRLLRPRSTRSTPTSAAAWSSTSSAGATCRRLPFRPGRR